MVGFWSCDCLDCPLIRTDLWDTDQSLHLVSSPVNQEEVVVLALNCEDASDWRELFGCLRIVAKGVFSWADVELPWNLIAITRKMVILPRSSSCFYSLISKCVFSALYCNLEVRSIWEVVISWYECFHSMYWQSFGETASQCDCDVGCKSRIEI